MKIKYAKIMPEFDYDYKSNYLLNDDGFLNEPKYNVNLENQNYKTKKYNKIITGISLTLIIYLYIIIFYILIG
jgi:hypothetical protein